MQKAPEQQNEPKKKWPRNKLIAAAGLIVIVAIIAIIAAGTIFKAPSTAVSQTAPSSVPSNIPQGVQPVQNSEPRGVDFTIQPGSQEKCGLTCRQLTPTVTNTGTSTAHNVCVTIALYNSGGDIILLNGKPSVTKCVGDMKSGESKSEPVTIDADCGLFASKCIGQTLILKTQAVCDETTVRFPDKMIAV